jgi:hypothetical protein
MFKVHKKKQNLTLTLPRMFSILLLISFLSWSSPANSHAGQVIYNFTSPNYSTSTTAPSYIPSALTLGVQSDLDTLEIGVEFPNNLSADKFLPQPVTGLSGTVTPILLLALSPINSNTQVRGVYSGTINLSTSQQVYSYDVPAAAKSWVSTSRFGSEASGQSISPCNATSALSSTRRQVMVFTISRSCTELPAQFSLQAQVKFLSSDGNVQFSPVSPASPMIVDLTKVPGFKLPQTISAQPIPNVYVGQNNLVISATNSANLSLLYSVVGSNGVCSVSNQNSPNVTLQGPGQCTVSISSAGNAMYSPANSVQLVFQVQSPQLDQTISSNIPNTISMDDPRVSIQTSSSSGANVTATTSTGNICQILNPQTIEAINPGICQITLSTPTNGNYKAAQSQISVSVTPAHKEQNVSYSEPKNIHVGQTSFELKLVSDSGLRLQVTSNSPSVCKFEKPSAPLLVTVVGEGTCDMEVSQSGNANYFPFSASGVTFEVLPAGKLNVPTNGTNAPSAVTIKSSVSTGRTSSKVQSQTTTTSVVSTKSTATVPKPSSSPNKFGVKISTSSKVSKTPVKATPKTIPSTKKN